MCTSGYIQLFRMFRKADRIGYLAHHGSLGPHSCSLDTLIGAFTTKTDKELVSMYRLSSLGKSWCLTNRKTYGTRL